MNDESAGKSLLPSELFPLQTVAEYVNGGKKRHKWKVR